MRKPFAGDYPVTQTWGNKFINNGVDVYAQWGLKGHDGIDFGLPSGTRVLAPHAGTVIEVNYDSNGYGNYIKIESDTEGSVLAHLDDVKVQVGFIVNEGDFIATSDNTGYSTGAHLHWGYYRKPRNRQDGYLGFIDQMPYINNDAPVNVTPAVPAKYYTEEEYQKIVKERDAALQQAKTDHDEMIRVNTLYSGFAAIGYAKPEDITTKTKTYDETILGLNTQILTALDRNKKLAKIIFDKENEDSTAIEEGVRAVEELAEAKDHIKQIAKVAGAKPNLYDIVRHLFNAQSKAKEAVEKAKQEVQKGMEKAKQEIPEGTPIPVIINEPTEKYGLQWLMSFLGLKGGAK